MNFNTIVSVVRKAFFLSLKGLAIALLAIYYQTNIYDFIETKPFSGKYLYNPYQVLATETSIKANFHAHSVAWGGITNGHNTKEEIEKFYIKNGYSVAAVSNYHELNKTQSEKLIEIPTYEHGLNIRKSHKLAIYASDESYFDYPLFQNTSQKQQIILNLRDKNALVAIAHPNFGHGHNEEDMKQLSGYHFVEVLNHYRVSDAEWDAGLSNGKLSWILANDDTHSLEKEPSARIWNRIFVKYKNKAQIIDALKKGQNYGIKSENGVENIHLSSIKVKNDTIFYQFLGDVQQVNIIVDGTLKASNKNGNGFYLLKSNESYVRFVAKNNEVELYTNPIIRYNKVNIPITSNFSPPINGYKTLLYRGFILFILILIISSTTIKNRFVRQL